MLRRHHGPRLGEEERGKLVLSKPCSGSRNTERASRVAWGAFLFLVAAWGAPCGEPGELAGELLEEGHLEAGRVECRRLHHAGHAAADLPLVEAPAGTRTTRPTRGWRRVLTYPARLLIRFYRVQISPAIGQRCSLHPSCSEYARQALLKHGPLGLAMYADRAVREPRVVAERKNPVTRNGRRLYRDPLEEHDYWLED